MYQQPEPASSLADTMRALQTAAGKHGGGWTVLHAAAAAGNVAAIRYLVRAGMPVDAPNEDGDTPLHISAQTGQPAAAQALLAAGASRTAGGALGHTPAQRATAMGHEALARCLARSPKSAATTFFRRLRRLLPF